MIEFRACSKAYGKKPVLEELDLTVQAGEHVLITGVSGCGKSTLLRVLAGLESLNSGEVLLNDDVVTKGKKNVVEANQRSIGYVPQDLGLWGNLSVKHNIKMGRKVDDASYEDLLEQAELGEMENKAVSLLSAGERQRVSLVRALVMKPKVLLMDEPFSSLDIPRKQQFYRSVKRLVKADCTVLTVSHDPADWVGLSPSRIAVIEGGEIKESHRRNAQVEDFSSEILKCWKQVGFSL